MGPLLWKLGIHRFVVFTVYLRISIVCLVLHVYPIHSSHCSTTDFISFAMPVEVSSAFLK